VLVAIAIGLVANVQAVPVSFQIYPTGNSNPNVSSQFTMDVTDNGSGQALFRLANSGAIQSTITDILFYDGSLLGISALKDRDDQISGLFGLSTVDFTAGVPFHPDSLPQYPAATFGTDRDSNGGVGNGVDTGEWLEILFNLKANRTFADLLAELQSGQVYVGLHVQRIGTTGGSDWYESTPPPSAGVPDGGTTICLLGLGLLALAGVRRALVRA